MSDKLPSVRIETNGIYGKVFVNGEEVLGVRGYSIQHNAGSAPSLLLDIVSDEITFDGGNFVPKLPEVYKSFYEPKEFNL